MNNDQFRRLALGAGAGAQSGSKNDDGKASASPSAGVLGSRQKASIPMTPRSGGNVSRVTFARQMAERFQDADKQKRFRTSAPKGSRLAEGYVDRAKARTGDEKRDERETRLAALEEAHKSGEIDRETYEKLQLEIAGGDLSSTHLVKGLDFKLLERVRKGEDVFGEDKEKAEDVAGEEDAAAEQAAGSGADFDDEFERLETSEVHTVAHEKAKKKGQLAPAALVPGKKRTRDQILAEMKAAREAAKKKESILGSRFKKIGVPQKAGSRIERDSHGREVLIIVDEDGHEKRKVRKVASSRAADAEAAERDREREAMAPAKDAEVLGMEVPEFYKKKQEAEAAAAAEEAAKPVDIFEDADSDYDPLAGLDSGSDSDSDEESKLKEKEKEEGEASDSSPDTAKRPAPAPQPRKSYFQGSLLSEEASARPSLNDPAVLAALRKAKSMREAAETEEKSKETEREERLKKLLESSNRDNDDLDMGFGTNRLEDDEDMEEKDIKLSKWGGEGGGDGDGDRAQGGKAKRKRGAKKRKGDGNNAADVLRVLDQRKKAGGNS